MWQDPEVRQEDFMGNFAFEFAQLLLKEKDISMSYVK